MSKTLGVFIIILLIILIPFAYFSFKPVKVGEVGVKTRLLPITGGRGISNKTLKTGLYLVIPFAEKLDLFNARIQKLDFVAPQNMKRKKNSQNIYVQTSDGTFVYVDATLLFKVDENNAYKLLATLGHNYIDKKVRPEFVSVLKAKLGELKAEDFFNPEVREAKVKEALEELNKRLEENGIQAVNILVRDYFYSEDYENAIREKKIADQIKLLNKVKTIAAQKYAELKKTEAYGDALANIELEKGNADAKKIEADADNYLKLKQAEAKKVIETAKAKGDALIQKAFAGQGGKNIVGLKMAEVLKGLDRIIIQSGGKNGVNPLDVNSLLKLSGVKK